MREASNWKIERTTLIMIVIVVLLAPFSGSRLALYSLTITAIYAVVVVSLNILLGLAGQVSFAQTSFMAIGGYGSALLTTRLGVNPWLAMVSAAIIALLVAVAIGRPLLRLRGHYLAMATFSLALGTFSFVGAAEITNGGMGISGVPSFAIAGHLLDDPLSFYILSWVVCALATLIFYMLANSYIGRAWRALATGQDIAATLGIDVTRYKVLAFAIAAVMASFAGSLYVEFTTFAGPDLYDVGIILNIFLMLFVGGRGSTFGPIVGAGLLIMLPQAIAGLEQYQNLVFFIFLLLVILIWPSGLLGHSNERVTLDTLLPAWMVRHRRAS